MESSSSFTEIVCPFDTEWKFNKADLMALKGSECLSGKCFYAYNIPGLQYYLYIYPRSDRKNAKKPCAKTKIYLCVNGSNERKITANFVISVESANVSKSINYVYEKNIGHGKKYCKTCEFFDSKNKYFVNGEITIKAKGTLKIERPLISKISYPVSTQWKIKEDDLKEIQNGILYSKYVATFSDVSCYLGICPEDINKENKATASLSLFLEIKKKKNVEAVFDFSIDSANFNRVLEDVYEKNDGCGIHVCSTEDLFNPSKRYIVDGFLTIKVNGILMVEKNLFISLNCKNGILPKSDFKKGDKDFTIVVGSFVIQVHKQVLMEASPVLAGMLNSGMKETTESKMIITDFPFKIVEAAIKLCYSTNGARKFAFEEMLSLYQFADKYRIQFILDLVEEYLIKKLSPSNVCQLIKFSSPDSLNVIKLHQRCTEFLIKCFKESTPVNGSDALDKDFVFTMFLNALCPTVNTDL